MEKALDLIAKNEIFHLLNPAEITSLKEIISFADFQKGDLVFDTNKAPQFLFIVRSGSFILQLPNSEYKNLDTGELFGEIGIINKEFRSGSVRATENSSVIQICGTKLFQKEYIAPATSLKVMSALAKRITNYLRSKEQVSTTEIIEEGESDQVEFKSTLRWNLHSDRKDKAIENASLKTMVAFMNTAGGILLVGVSDDGTLLGLENDKFPNHDKFLLHLTSLVKDRIGSTFNTYLHFSIEEIGEKYVLRIDCQPATKPAYLSDGNQDHFYIRTGPSTTDLRLRMVYPYIRERFYPEPDTKESEV